MLATLATLAATLPGTVAPPEANPMSASRARPPAKSHAKSSPCWRRASWSALLDQTFERHPIMPVILGHMSAA
jgi:hypothetical protein